jgi:hypothetical protein
MIFAFFCCVLQIHIIPEGFELLGDLVKGYHGAGGLPVVAGATWDQFLARELNC